MIALQYCLDFCQASTWINHRCTYVPSLLNLSLTFHPFPPLSVITEPQLEFLEPYSKFPLALYSHMLVYRLHPFLSIHLILSLFSPTLICKSVLCLHCCSVNRFISAIFLDSIYIYVNIQYLFFSFWLTSLCIIGSKFIHLIRTDSNVFLFMAE